MLEPKQSTAPHCMFLDLHNDGVMHECAIMKEDDAGNVFYFEIAQMDRIDKSRFVRILSDRNVNNFELWDLMAQHTLNNGVNALEYFHQMVRVLTPSGKIISPRQGVRGAERAVVDTNPDPMAVAQQKIAENEAAAEEVADRAAKKKSK